MPECLYRASIVSLKLDSRQKQTGMTAAHLPVNGYRQLLKTSKITIYGQKRISPRIRGYIITMLLLILNAGPI